MKLLVCVWLCLAGLALARPWVVAHRGGTVLGAENRLSTFEKAIALGVDAIELDIHLTRDNKLVVIHDETVDRTFPGHTGRVAEMTLEQAQALGLPSLEQALQLCKGRCRVLVEIKHPHGARYEGIEQALLAVLERQGMLDQVVVISFDAKSLRILRQLDGKIPTGYLTSKAQDPDILKSDPNPTYSAPHFQTVDRAYVTAAHARGLKVSVWTVNDRTAMQQMRDLDCDAITTNDPAMLLEVLGPR